MLNNTTFTKENKMKNFTFIIKELGIFLLWGITVLFAAFGGAAILLSNL